VRRCTAAASLQARAGLQELWRVTVSDMFSDTPGQPAPLLRQIVRRLLQGTELADVQQVRRHAAHQPSLKAPSLAGLCWIRRHRDGLQAG
jgi:hypothetical protein